MALKKLGGLPKSFPPPLKKMDYNQWQRHSAGKKTAVKVILPPVAVGTAKKDDRKPKEKLSGKKPTSASPSKNLRPGREKSGRYRRRGSEAALSKSMVNIKVLQRLAKAKKTSLEELKHHSRALMEKNHQLMKDIQEKDADTARRARDLLQQYDMFGTIITTLQDSSQNQVGVAKAELQEAEKMVEKNMGKLEAELSQMNAKVRALQEELNVLRTYMDKEYPVKSVQIASLLRSIQDLSEEQQDELEEAELMAKQFLETIVNRSREETERILQVVVEEKIAEYQEGLQQMARNNRELQQQIEIQKQLIESLEEEIELLQKDTVVLHKYIRHPRDVIFQDVLLQKPMCTPDMEVVLNIPTEEDIL